MMALEEEEEIEQQLQALEREARSGRESSMELPHAAHKIPAGNGPYARAKHLQLVEKDLDASVPWFLKAIAEGDRFDSALKDLAVVLKQLGRPEAAIDVIEAFRSRCSNPRAHDSLDNLLLDLYKTCGRIKEEIGLLKQKLRRIYDGEAFNGKGTRKARSHGKKIHVSVKQETSRILGNLAWAYMQQRDYGAAEAVYRKAQLVDPDANKACNLAVCLVERERLDDAERVLMDVVGGRYDGTPARVAVRAEQLLKWVSLQRRQYSDDGVSSAGDDDDDDDDTLLMLDSVLRELSATRLPIFEEIYPCREQMAGC